MSDKKRIRPGPDERSRLIVSAAAAAAFLIAALLLPLAFRGGGQEVQTGAGGARAELFAAYWSGEREGLEILGGESLTKRYAPICEERINEIISSCTFDKNELLMQSEGHEYLTVRRGEDEVTLCRFWRQYQGDWRNWLDVCFDADTGDVYYLYLSSECVKNRPEYTMSMPAGLDAMYVASRLAERDGCRLLDAQWNADASGTLTAIYSVNGSALKMSISCIYYESTLIDIKLVCI